MPEHLSTVARYRAKAGAVPHFSFDYQDNQETQVANLIKLSAAGVGLPRPDYSTHSLRIGGACALLTAGKSDLGIRLLGRWASWCFTVYTKLRPE
ncbi:hypothetical protein PF002_g18196 [Phytophthora fragariae]|uniref:Tyr recombinase domain-containing protein n=1 Tax=Phytophthora fragariae TaxID=53985 RepID=A0A6A3TFJ2_9STRA|nr:hypothetical protein PF003_g2203 [Phytophthora fragariae]KAE8932041.1 hypothetical protein PF009_g17915 [Phytophthora fragariae]KAE9129602.1 hypothetical protein PF006_g15968 [Phytophthora fragariae]KAE9212621.1 hypothetical protein PF002_g18196 [Phytophthora fragariae]KAE9296434.1 hypothetical protein PF001_g16865 [Phytophthora fragariae]